MSSLYSLAVIQIFLLTFGEMEDICLVPPFVRRTNCHGENDDRLVLLGALESEDMHYILASPLICCMTSGQLLKYSLPQNSHLQNGYSHDTKLMVLLSGLSKMMRCKAL